MLPPAWQKRLVDVNVEPLTEQDLAWADCAFIGATVVQEKSARQISERCHASGIRVVAGGPLFLLPQARFETVDHFVLNEAEVTLPLFLADLAQGQARRLYDTTQFADIHLTPAPVGTWRTWIAISACPSSFLAAALTTVISAT